MALLIFSMPTTNDLCLTVTVPPKLVTWGVNLISYSTEDIMIKCLMLMLMCLALYQNLSINSSLFKFNMYHIYQHTHTHAHMHAHTHTHTHAHTHVHTHTHTEAQSNFIIPIFSSSQTSRSKSPQLHPPVDPFSKSLLFTCLHRVGGSLG